MQGVATVAAEPETTPVTEIDGIPVTEAVLVISGRLAVDVDDELFCQMKLGRKLRIACIVEAGAVASKAVPGEDGDFEVRLTRAARITKLKQV